MYFGQQHLDHLLEVVVDGLEPVLAENTLAESQACHFLHDLAPVDLLLGVEGLQVLDDLLPAHEVAIDLR